jgi:hypothetical protein
VSLVALPAISLRRAEPPMLRRPLPHARLFGLALPILGAITMMVIGFPQKPDGVLNSSMGYGARISSKTGRCP